MLARASAGSDYIFVKIMATENGLGGSYGMGDALRRLELYLACH